MLERYGKKSNMAKYSAIVFKENEKDTDYIVSVDCVENTSATEKKDGDPMICFQAALTEYEFSIKRSEKLDNKIYILLTVCAFLFVALTTSIERISDIRFPQTCVEYGVIGAFIFLVIVTAICVALLLKDLISSLSSFDLIRFNSSEIVVRDMTRFDEKRVAKYIIAMYIEATEKNDVMIEERYKKLDCSIKKLVASIMLLLLLSLLGNILPIAKDNEYRLCDFYSFDSNIQADKKKNETENVGVTHKEVFENEQKQ